MTSLSRMVESGVLSRGAGKTIRIKENKADVKKQHQQAATPVVISTFRQAILRECYPTSPPLPSLKQEIRKKKNRRRRRKKMIEAN